MHKQMQRKKAIHNNEQMLKKKELEKHINEQMAKKKEKEKQCTSRCRGRRRCTTTSRC